MADNHLEAVNADDPVTTLLLCEADIAFAEGFGGSFADFGYGVHNLLDFLLQHGGGHVHAPLFHPGVCLGHGGKVGVQIRLQLFVVDRDLGLEVAIQGKFLKVFNLCADAGAVVQGQVPPIDEAKPDAQGVPLAGSPVIHRDPFHKSLILFNVQIEVLLHNKNKDECNIIKRE